MNLADYLTPQMVAVVSGSTKAEALQELIAVLTDADVGVGPEEIERAVRQREEMMSTGIGHGLGIPHVRMAGLTRTAMAVGVSKAGIADYASLDDRPVHIIVLIAAPEGQHEIYIRLLAEVTEVLKQQELRLKIIQAETPQQIYEILTSRKT